MDWTTGVRFSAGAVVFSLRRRVHTGSGARPSSYPMSIGSKTAGAWSWQLTSI